MRATVQSIIDRVTHVTKDYDHVRWTIPELALWINDAQGVIAQVHPRAAAVYYTLALNEGARQDLQLIDPTKHWVRLYHLVCNTMDGEPTGTSIRQVHRGSLDYGTPRWRTRPPTARIVDEFWVDEHNPYVFEVSPPVVEGVEVNALVAFKPDPVAALDITGTALADPDELFGLPHGYDIPAADYVLYRCFSKDANDPSYQQRSALHFQSFQLSMGVEVSDATTAQ